MHTVAETRLHCQSRIPRHWTDWLPVIAAFSVLIIVSTVPLVFHNAAMRTMPQSTFGLHVVGPAVDAFDRLWIAGCAMALSINLLAVLGGLPFPRYRNAPRCRTGRFRWLVPLAGAIALCFTAFLVWRFFQTPIMFAYVGI